MRILFLIIALLFLGCQNGTNDSNSAELGTPIRNGYPFYLQNGEIKWFDGAKFLFKTTSPNEYNETAKFSYEGFKKAIEFASSKKYFSMWFVKEWFDNGAPSDWYEWSDIQKAMDEGKIPVFIFYYFGDSLTQMPTQDEIDDYYQAADTFANYISKLKGEKIIIIEPEFNKNFIVNDENNSKTMAGIFSNAIDIIKSKVKDAKFSLCMMDTGKRNANETYPECGYANCALGDKSEWIKSYSVYKYLLDKIDFISFQEMVSQFSRDPDNPGTQDNPNLIHYTDSQIGIDYLAKRVENLSAFLHDTYKKPVLLAYVAIASGTWDDKNSNGQIDDGEFNKDGWDNKIYNFYNQMYQNRYTLYKKGLIAYIPMALIDDPQHDINGWQFFNKNEYHLGLIETSAKDEEGTALYGDLKFKAEIK
ncbi:hypothetical protein [Caminibacter pacificus]